jgi:hypothetical protein
MGKRLEQLISKLNGKRENLPWNNRYLIPFMAVLNRAMMQVIREIRKATLLI